MNNIIAFLTFRTIVLLSSTTFSILAIMLLLNIITADDIIVMFKLSPDSATALKLIIERFREVSRNILDVLSQLISKLLSWAGSDVDLSKIKIDLNQANPNILEPIKQ